MEQVKKRKNIAELFESDAAVLIHEDIFFDVSVEQTISYLENNLIKARRPELQVRVAYHLIKVITCNIIKKHCL